MTNAKVNDKRMFLFNRNVIFDSGQTYVYLPTIEFNKFYDEVKASHKCFEKFGLPYCECSGDRSNWPVIQFQMGDGENKVWLFLTGNDYLNPT
jgi:hypothetical protein